MHLHNAIKSTIFSPLQQFYYLHFFVVVAVMCAAAAATAALHALEFRNCFDTLADLDPSRCVARRMGM